MNEELLSIKRLALVLDCSPKTVRDWMYKNRRTPASDPLPYYRVGGLVRFRLDDVMAWIDRRRVRVSPFSVLTGVRQSRAQVRSQPGNL